jgi:D-glycero-D-manno-heptose 1,7-bisphosphate phosphatase
MRNKSKKIVFLDRDGIINKKAKDHEYITKVEDFVFNEGVFKILEDLKHEGCEFIIITNQRGIARSKFSENDLRRIHDHMIEIFKGKGLDLLDIFYCPHEKDRCDCRKPKPGLLEQAANKYDIDLAQSILMSDSLQDVEMGKKFGIGRNILLKTDTLELIEERQS